MTESRQITPVQEICLILEKREPQFARALAGTNIKVQKFLRVAQTAVQTNPSLVMADRESLYAACTKAAQDGLLPDGVQAALVVYNTNKGSKQNPQWVQAVQYQPMIAGILRKLRNSGELSSIVAMVLHERDITDGHFKYGVDSDGEHLEFCPDLFSDRGPPVGAFAMAKLTDGALYVEIMTMEQIEQVRAVSRAAQSGPWVSWWDQMAKKTVLKRLSKRLPMSTDIEGMFGYDTDDERVVAVNAPPPPTQPEMRDVTPEPEPSPEPKKRQSRARAAVEAAPAPGGSTSGVEVASATDAAMAATVSAPDVQPEPPTIDHYPRDDDGVYGDALAEDEVPI